VILDWLTSEQTVKSREHYQSLTYETMRSLALDDSLDDSERVGFPATYRKAKERMLFDDIVSKLTNLALDNQLFIDIGSGFSKLTECFISQLRSRGTRMVFSDSEEMLGLFPKNADIELIPGPFPENWPQLAHLRNQATAVLCYSVLHMVAHEGNVLGFADHLTALLKTGGQLLIGDIPNASKRARFFGSERGRRSHQNFAAEHPGLADPADVPHEFLTPPLGSLDDSFILSLVAHFRCQGFGAYVMPQNTGLPFFNRREDILVVKH
jgi:hypothetical protein